MTTRPAAIDGGDSLDGPQHRPNPDPFAGADSDGFAARTTEEN